MNRWLYLAPYSLILFTVFGYLAGGWANFSTPLFIFGGLPLLDWLCGRNTANFSQNDYLRRRNERFFRLVTWFYVPIQCGLIAWGATSSAADHWEPIHFFGFVMSIGLVTGGVGITFAHELGHRNNPFEQNLAKILLSTVCYTHFFIEHNQGHHAQVATPDDPASARLGESLYRFLPRTLIGSFSHAWQLERRRLNRRGRPTWCWSNRMIRYTLSSVAIAGVIWLWTGPMGLLFFVGQSLVAVLLLEMVNYIEHYGLQRAQKNNGGYERVAPIHSWNSSERVTNCFLIELQRHSDHHANPNRRYQTLRHFDESPQLPTGYAGMILLALLPPVWHRIMDPRVAVHASEFKP